MVGLTAGDADLPVGRVPDPGFVRELHRALRHLYNPAELRISPLPRLLGFDQQKDPSSSLRRILTDAIEALKPGSTVPRQATAWRIYQILRLRFTEQFTQRDVAADLALSIRQLRREESTATRLLADYLWGRYDVAPRLHSHDLRVPTMAGVARPGDAAAPPEEELPSHEQELEWVKKSLPSETVDPNEAIRAALSLVAPLAQALSVHIECAAPMELPNLAVHKTPMRQALLIVLTTAIRCARGAWVHVGIDMDRWDLCVSVKPTRARATSVPTDLPKALQMARALLEISGGSLEVTRDNATREPFSARLIFPVAECVTVLVIDDNADTQQLYQRYLTGSRYRSVGVHRPEEALSLAAEMVPQIIVLDVMLPGIDGWEMLGRLSAHPRLRGVPIVVCTILPQEQLALSLGAAAFVSKPVSRSRFLAVLNRQLDALAKGSD